MKGVIVTLSDEEGEAVGGFAFSLSSLTTPHAIEIRPEIDRTIRILRMAADYCDALIDEGIKQRAKEHRQREITSDSGSTVPSRSDHTYST